MTSPDRFIVRMAIVILGLIGLSAFLYEPLRDAFAANIFLNGLILGVLLLGVLYNFRQVVLLYPEVNWIERFRLNTETSPVAREPRLLSPMVTMLSSQKNKISLSTHSMRSLLDGMASRLDESRELSRYTIGLLIFLGLLGTFWGLLETVNSIGNVIGSLSVTGGDFSDVFAKLKDGLIKPLDGMGTAFSSSLFGLAGSLILGFMDINLGQAQNKFSQYFEKIANLNSSPEFSKILKSDNTTDKSIQKIYENLDNIVFALKETTKNQNQLYSNFEKLNEILKQINSNSVELDKKLSNFLSTQLNTQSSMLQLTNQLNENGLIDKKTKKIFENLDKGIKQLILKNKKVL